MRDNAQRTPLHLELEEAAASQPAAAARKGHREAPALRAKGGQRKVPALLYGTHNYEQ